MDAETPADRLRLAMAMQREGVEMMRPGTVSSAIQRNVSHASTLPVLMPVLNQR